MKGKTTSVLATEIERLNKLLDEKDRALLLASGHRDIKEMIEENVRIKAKLLETPQLHNASSQFLKFDPQMLRKIAEFETQKDSLVTENQSLKTQLAHFDKKMKSVNQTIRESEFEKSELRKLIQENELENRNLQARIAMLESRFNKAFLSAEANVEQLKNIWDDEKDSLQRAFVEREQKLMKELERAKTSVNELIAARGVLHADFTYFYELFKRICSDNALREQRFSQVQLKYEQEANQLKIANERLELSLEEQNMKLSTIESAFSRMKNVETQFEDLKLKNRNLVNDHLSLLSEFEGFFSEFEARYQANTQLHSNLQNAQLMFNQAVSTNNYLVDKISSMNRMVHNLKYESENLNGVLQELQRKLAGMKGNSEPLINSLKQEIGLLTQQLLSMKQNSMQMLFSSQIQHSNLERANNIMIQKEGEMQDWIQKARFYHSQWRNATLQLNEESQNLSYTVQSLVSLEEEVKNFRKQSQLLTPSTALNFSGFSNDTGIPLLISSEIKRNRELENELSLLKNKLTTMERENSMLKDQLAEKFPQNYALFQSEVGVSVQKLEKLQEQVFLLKSELDYFKGLKPPKTCDAEIATEESIDNSEKNYLFQQIDRISKEKAKLISILDLNSLDMQRLQDALLECRSTVDAQNVEISNLSEERDFLRRKLDGQSEDLKETKLRLAEKQNRMAALQNQIATLNSEITSS